MKTKPAISRWTAALCLATLLVGVGGREPWTPDEPRETALAAQMARRGLALFPRLGGKPFVEKPPFYYWVSALVMRAFSATASEATAARAVSAVSAGLTLLLVAAAGHRGRSPEFGTAALAILATMFGFFRAGHWIIIDPLLMLMTAAAVLLPYAGLSEDRPLLFLAGCLAAGLGVLTKGFVAGGLIFFPWGMLLLLYFRKLIQRPGLLAAGAFLLLGPPATWMVLFRLAAGPELWREWFIINQLGRFSGQAAHLGHIKGPFYYLWLAPLLCLPWTPALLGGWFCRSRAASLGHSPRLMALAAVWGLGGFLVLSLAGTKREVYFYPLLPAFALLTAAALENLPRWSESVLTGLSAVFPPAILFFAFTSHRWTGEKIAIHAGFDPLTTFLGVAAVLAFFHLRKRPAGRMAAVAAFFYLAAGRVAPPILNQFWSYRPMAETLAAAIPPSSRYRVAVWSTDETTQGVFFYYAGITLPTVKDPNRARTILEGRDPDFDLIVVPRWDEFERASSSLPTFRVLARAPRGRRRLFHLIGPPEAVANRTER